MPRIYDSDRSPEDFCRRCFPSEVVAQKRYGQDIDYNAEHPPYEDTDYRCLTCRRPLQEGDN